jgi:PAS domain-containing protein
LIFTDCVIQTASESTFSVIHINNQLIEVNISITPTKCQGDEKPYLYFLLAKDITEQRKKELDLLRFYNVAENTVNPLQITDVQGKMVYANPAFVQVSGYSKEELIGKNPSVFGSGKALQKILGKNVEYY